MKLTIELPFSESDFSQAVTAAERGDGKPLRTLCQIEVALFEQYVRVADPSFADGLVQIEKLAVQGYLYQKMRGHIDATDRNPNVSKERKDGTT